MEALSPRSTNIQARPKPFNEKDFAIAEAPKLEPLKVEPAKVEDKPKDKEHASPPPPWVLQPPLKPGLLAEKFHTGRFLGKGGFAICYEGELRGKKTGLGNCKFAMKIVKATTAQTKTMEKFRTELQIHAKMRHPSIVQFHRAFTFKENTYIILELCPNGSVMDMMRKRKGLTLPEVRRFTVQICGAIKYMHTRNVIHRDLKMGNLFLDKDMNIKLGDFGLAAILATKAECKGIHNFSMDRRTTVCGTPNYIAPEILKKGKNGHDHKVDIWAIGIIVYAMLTGYPPFQSSSQREIYERVKNVTYDWPLDSQCINDIPEEAKDLVASLLKEDAMERPECDQIVGHPFFSMHGGNAIPWAIDRNCRINKPSWLRAEQPRGDVMDLSCSVVRLSTLARQCGVGHLPDDEQPFQVVGGNVNLSLYQECLAEEIEGTYPVVPLPKDMVYTSQSALMDWPSEQSSNAPQLELESQAVIKESASEEDELHFNIPNILRRRPTQSHAATLRAAQFGSMPCRKLNIHSTVATRGDTGSVRQPAPNTSSLRTRRGLLNEQPIRSLSNPSNIKGPGSSLKISPRITRSKSASMALIPPVSTAVHIVAGHHRVEITSSKAESEHSKAVQEKGRASSNMGEKLQQGIKRLAQSPIAPLPVRPRPSANIAPQGTLIGPGDIVEPIPGTKPTDVLENLHKTWNEIHNSLASKSTDTRFSSIIARKEREKRHLLVRKWVDYTHKYGIGYVLDNGTVGCVFNGDSINPQSCILVPGAESHTNNKRLASYPEKLQYVAKDGAPVHFLENCAEEGFKRVRILASQFQLRIGENGTTEMITPGTTSSDFAKRRKVSIWDKFGKYMSQNLGKTEDEAYDLKLEEETSRSRNQLEDLDCFIRFYQRLGNVGIWGFGNGSFHFNFPDHTKLVISDGGTWLDFYHLPVKAAKNLTQGVRLTYEALNKRGVLSYTTAVMVHGIYMKRDFTDIIVANDLVVKLEFVKKVLGTWIQNGGLGCLGTDEKYLMWQGMTKEGSMTEKSEKLVWVSVGAHRGDLRYHLPGMKERVH